jgi:hypothetical protein
MVALSSLLVAVLLVVLVISFITYFILSNARPTILNGLNPQTGLMDKPVKVGSYDDARNNFLVPAGATLSVYVFCAVNNKTQSIGTAPWNDIPILQMGNTLEIKIISGGISMPSKTQLVVLTQGPTAQKEIIELPEFPQQKWVQLVIVREGRRYTVYYNGKVVGSKRTQYFPVINSSQLTIGNPALRGEFSFPKIAPVPMRIEEIQEDLAATSNTRHVPIVTASYTPPSLFNIGIKFGCPNGIFCFSTSSPPTSDPLKSWRTPYA